MPHSSQKALIESFNRRCSRSLTFKTFCETKATSTLSPNCSPPCPPRETGVCVRERARAWKRERERERERMCVCVCVKHGIRHSLLRFWYIILTFEVFVLTFGCQVAVHPRLGSLFAPARRARHARTRSAPATLYIQEKYRGVAFCALHELGLFSRSL